VVFIVVAVVKIAALLSGSPRAFIIAMCAGMGLYAAWAVFFAASVIAPVASLNAPAWPLAVVGFHIAFMATLTERRPRG
jgi:xanthine/uracil/vitamin C permease (AzgA family)